MVIPKIEQHFAAIFVLRKPNNSQRIQLGAKTRCAKLYLDQVGHYTENLDIRYFIM